jgi:hypothetical protein
VADDGEEHVFMADKSGTLVRIGTALGSFVVEIRNDVGPIAGVLADEIEQAVLALLSEYRHLIDEMASVEIERATFDYEIRDA